MGTPRIRQGALRFRLLPRHRLLLRSQQQDGTWHVATRALGFQSYFESGFPHGHDQWISQGGTSLAATALTFAAK